MTLSLLTMIAPAQTGTGGGISVLVLQMAGIGLVFYFLILRPSAQTRKRHAELLSKLSKGDEVMTSGGIVGRVKDIREVQSGGVSEVRVTVESGTATVVIERSRIVRVGSAAGPTADAPST